MLSIFGGEYSIVSHVNNNFVVLEDNKISNDYRCSLNKDSVGILTLEIYDLLENQVSARFWYYQDEHEFWCEVSRGYTLCLDENAIEAMQMHP